MQKNYRKLTKKYPRQHKAIASYIQKLHICEAANEKNIEAAANLTGEAMAEIYAAKDDYWQDTLRQKGYYMGKFIYLMDAYEDIEEDLKQGRYNPFTELYKKETFEQDCQQILKMMMAETSKVFEQLPILEDAEILRNILYAGVWTRYGQIRCRRKETKKEA